MYLPKWRRLPSSSIGTGSEWRIAQSKGRYGYSDSRRRLTEDRRVRTIPNLAEVWSYINPYMLYGRHLGFKGNFEKLLADRDPKALELFHQVEDVKQEAAKFMKVRAVWQFFEAERDW